MNRCTRWLSILGLFVLLVGCASDVSSQHMAAYSVATGFLTLCDDADFDNALDHFAKPLKASPAGATWVKTMQAKRADYGAPVIRALIRRDVQSLNAAGNEPAKINFLFRTSFSETTPGEESVSVSRLHGKWQVYDYKFLPSGKPGGHKGAAKYKKNWEEQTDTENSQY